MPPPVEQQTEDQDKLLELAQAAVKKEAFQMKLCLDNNKLMEALKHASTVLDELRTSRLSPKTYYELYITIIDELRHLEGYLVDEFEKGRAVKDLYELVQYAGNIVPRLYLLVAVGAVYIHTKQVPRKDIMKDLVEMCRGVQHPLRGLFLRNYLLQSVKRYLPEAESDEDGTINDSIDFILLNFAEMNKLWVRMQHQGHSRDRQRREQERKELRLLVGTNLVRISALEALTVDKYKNLILPAVLEQVISCKDPIAQEYLLEAVIQVFPDDFHLQTLDTFLGTCSSLAAEVRVKDIIIAMIDRLVKFSQQEGGSGIPADIPLFDIFSDQTAALIKTRAELPSEDAVALEVALINLALRCYADKPQYADKVLQDTTQMLEDKKMEALQHNTPLSKQLVKLLKIVAEAYPSISNALALEHFVPMFAYFDYNTRHELAVALLQEAADKESRLTTTQEVTGFLEVISPLIKDQDDNPHTDDPDDEDFAAEQCLVGRLVNLLSGETLDVQFQMLSAARKAFGAGGEKRIRFTMPPLVFAAIKLADQYSASREEDDMWAKKVHKIYQFVHQTITALSKAEFQELALRLFLQAALAAGQVDFEKSETIAYEFMSQAFMIYEEELSDSRSQVSAICLLIGALDTMTCFGEENLTPLRTKCANVSNKLVLKTDKCRSLAMCTSLFWSDQADSEKRDGKQLLSCLQRALKTANSCMEVDMQVQLFIEIFNKYLIYYEKGVDQITMSHINKIGSLIKESLEKVEGSEEKESLTQQFQNTLSFVQRKKEQGGAGPSFAEFEVTA
eukprot:m.61840 g.61840  ORF g.61840 m.61840 type:complete len:791 (+) comp16225_c1_seq1:53-2425(+)